MSCAWQCTCFQQDFDNVANQDRGSLHLHLLIWLNHEFTPAQLKENVQNQVFRENLLKYLVDIII